MNTINPVARPFSIKLYLALVILISWPFQIAYPFLGENYRFLLLISMIMVAVATYISGKFVFKDGFSEVGWSWGKPKHYLFSFLLALFLWLFPSLIEIALGIYHPTESISTTAIILSFLSSFVITLLPAFSEEFGWRGYLLPRLFMRFTQKKALLIHGLITWIWHLPVLVFMGIQMGGSPLISIILILTISLIPTIMHAVVFAHIWNSSKSIAVATFYHVSFDEVRDALENSIGLGTLGQNWQMLVLTILGTIFLFKSNWPKKKSNSIN